jgi:peptidoglycan/xylan/chitin deacetylase (PgdA/CDA1 family)
VEAFYEGFYAAISERADWDRLKQARDSVAAFDHLSSYAFYSEADRRFRYLRDRVLTGEDYNQACLAMMRAKGYDPVQAARSIWMNDDDLRRLNAEGHCVGLHSETHPTNLGTWSKGAQHDEYASNLEHLTQVLGARPRTVAYPSGSYNEDTIAVMREMDIVIGFMSGHEGDARNLLEQPRLDWTLF